MKSRNFQNLPISEVKKDEDKAVFYNTIGLIGEKLTLAVNQNLSQELKILAYLKKFPTKKFTKSEIKKQLVLNKEISEKTPESSISRALSNLKEEKKVIKLEEFREGFLGKPNHLWQLKNEEHQVGSQLLIF